MQKHYISDDILYIGQDDAGLDKFESQYMTPDGMCYNSYLIVDDKIAIMDTSDARTVGGWMADLEKALGGKEPDYLVIHHMEPDHAAGIALALEKYAGLSLICTDKAARMMPLYFENVGFEGRIKAVGDGDTLSLGHHELVFISAPMVHWPEVMMTFDRCSAVLFSADAFGKFGVMDADPDDWACEARRYYFNICGKYGGPVSAVLKKMSAFPIKTILPLHGPVLTGEKMAEALRLYGIWSSYGVETEGVFIAFASIHGCTAQAAMKLAEILRRKSCPKVSVCDLTREDQAEAIEDAFRYGKVVLAASSYDGGLFPPMYDFIHHLQIKGWQKRQVALIENGSWAPSAARVMTEMLSEMKDVSIIGETLTLKGRMKGADISALDTLADSLI